MNPNKSFALLFLSALAFCSFAFCEGKVSVMEPVQVNVEYSAQAAVPIQFTSDGYNGPYDPADPKGLIAAQHRSAKLYHDSAVQNVKSYYPPGLGGFLKKETVKVAVKEGQRFAVSHPAETADLLAIVTKGKNLYHLGASKVKKATGS